MSDALATQIKPASTRTGPSDLQMLTQVEKWIAMIREINREQRNEAK